MCYLAVIRRAVGTFSGDFSLADLLARIDALDRSVPTLVELNDAFLALRQSGDLASHNWHPVSAEAYAQALESHRDAMARFCESQGISPEQQASVLQWHAALLGKHGA
jgi:hypothetical protein